MQEYGFPVELNILLFQIDDLTHNYKSTDGKNIKEILLQYCTKENFVNRYDGLFWNNEGYNWEYNKNIDVVALVDEFFIKYREQFYQYVPFLAYDSRKNYKTRLEYIDRTKE